jgi:maltose alpha-D-glucosyltransferase/alpha-amylase
MQWSPDRNAGFSRANPQKLYLPVIIDPEYHAEAVNVEAQQNNPNSLLWWMKRLVALRKRYQAFGRGSIEFLHPANRKILAFLRSHEEERLLVVANLSRLVQYVQLDLSAFRGMVPMEVFGHTQLPPVRDEPYFLTLGPHAFYWFSLEGAHPVAVSPRQELPVLNVRGSWQDLLEPAGRAPLEGLLPSYLANRRWFGGKARTIRSATILEALPISDHSSRIGRDEAPAGYLTLVQVDYREGDPETYLLPLTSTPAQRVNDLERAISEAAVARVRTRDGDQMLFDATFDARFCRSLLDTIARRRHAGPRRARLVATRTEAFGQIVSSLDGLSPSLMGAEQSNTSIRFGYELLLKLFRRVGEGVNPDLEIGRFLTERRSFPHTPAVAGALEYQRTKAEPITIGILHAFVPNGGDAWRYTLDHLSRYVEGALMRKAEAAVAELPGESGLAAAFLEPPKLACETMPE